MTRNTAFGRAMLYFSEVDEHEARAAIKAATEIVERRFGGGRPERKQHRTRKAKVNSGVADEAQGAIA